MPANWIRTLTAAVLLGVALSPSNAAVAQEPAEAGANAVPVDGDELGTEIRQRLDDILAQPEYRRVRIKVEKGTLPPPRPQWQPPQWLRDFMDSIGRYIFQPIFRVLSLLFTTAPAFVYLALVAVIGFIGYLVGKAIASYRHRVRTETEQPKPEEGETDLNPGDVPADVYLQRAAEFAQKGMYREAMAHLLLGAMSQAERAEWIRHRRGLTHRDYLRSMRGRDRPYAGFKMMVGIYEPVCFGRREPAAEHYETALQGYESGFKS